MNYAPEVDFTEDEHEVSSFVKVGRLKINLSTLSIGSYKHHVELKLTGDTYKHWFYERKLSKLKGKFDRNLSDTGEVPLNAL